MPTIIDNFKSVYSNLNAANINLVEKIYDDNITFIDPFHEIRGLENLSDYFSALYKNVESCQFEFGEVYLKNSSAVIIWNMSLKHRSLSKDVVEVAGSTQIRFDDKIYFHRDYFDGGKMLYENIPVVGSVINYIKKQV